MPLQSATQARDLALLHEEYDIEAVQPVDMFPHTQHVENVATLDIKESMTYTAKERLPYHAVERSKL